MNNLCPGHISTTVNEYGYSFDARLDYGYKKLFYNLPYINIEEL